MTGINIYLIDSRSYLVAIAISALALFVQYFFTPVITFLYPAIILSALVVKKNAAFVTLFCNIAGYLYFSHWSDFFSLFTYGIFGSMIVVLIDNSKTSEKDLRQTVRKLENIQHALDSSSIVAITDRNGVIKFVNDKFCKISQFSREEIIGKTHKLINSGHHDNAFFKNLWETIASGKVWHGEIKNRAKDGSFYWVDTYITPFLNEDGIPYEYIAIRNDITERKLFQEELEIGQARLKAVIDNSPYVFFMKDRNGRYVLYNSQFENLFQDKSKDRRGKTDYEIFPENMASNFTRNDIEVWRTRKPIMVEESMLIDGEDKIFMSIKFPLGVESDKPYAIAGISIDITERKKMENDLRTALESRDRFLDIASHELRTPLTSMKLQMQIFNRQLQKGNHSIVNEEKISKLISDSLKQTSSLEKLVNDMLDISRINTGKISYHYHDGDLCKIVQNVAESLRQNIESTGSKLYISSCPELKGKWDLHKIEQVLINVINNATKYGRGSPINIRISREHNQARIEISDGGIGIASEDQQRIFEQFERAVKADEVSGFGLGLYISRKILHAHDGDITVVSSPGKGSTFIISLPVSRDFRLKRDLSL